MAPIVSRADSVAVGLRTVDPAGAVPPGPVCDPGLPRPLRRVDAAHITRAMGLLDRRRGWTEPRGWTWEEFRALPERGDHPRTSTA